MRQHYCLLYLKFAILVSLFYIPQKILGMEAEMKENLPSSNSSSGSYLGKSSQDFSLNLNFPLNIGRELVDTSDSTRNSQDLVSKEVSSRIPSIQTNMQKEDENSLSSMDCSTSPGKEKRKGITILGFTLSPGRQGNVSTSPRKGRNGSITGHDLKLDNNYPRDRKGSINSVDYSSPCVSSMDCSTSPERGPTPLMLDSPSSRPQLSQEKLHSPTSLSQTNDNERDQFLSVLKLIEKDGAYPISGSLALHMTLKTLDLSNFSIRGTGGVIATLLTNNTTLTALKLGNCGLQNSDASEIFQSLCTNTTLTTLTLCFNLLEEGMRGKYVAKALRTNTSLTALDLSGIKINTSNIKSISEALTQIILFHDSSVGYVRRYQPQFLRTLNLSSMSLGDIGAEHFGVVLSTNTALTELNLRKNNISALGVSYITQALSKNTTLATLDLRENQINKEAKAALKKLKKNNKLNVLYLEMATQNDNRQSNNDILEVGKKQKRQLNTEHSDSASKK